jgi:alpha-mannosidase
LERETEQRALAAEKFSTIGTLVNPRLQPDSEVLKQLWNDMVLYDEHTFGADRSVSDPKSEEAVGQLATKEHFAAAASQKREYVMRRALDGIADFIHDPQQTVVIFNPLNWQRTSLVETDLDKGRELVDLASNQAVPYQVLSVGESYRHVRFLAQDVPSVGYKAYALRETKQEPPTPPVVDSAGMLENEFYRVVLDAETGAVKSIFDKELNKELVDPSSAYRFDQYIYVTGADGPPNLINFDYDSRWSPPALSIHGASGGRLLSVTKEPQGIVARLESSGINTPRIETEITLLDGQKKIEFINRVHKEEVYTKEGIYFAFPLAMKAPRFRYEIQNGFVDPSRDQMPGAGNEWFSVQHWIAADQDGVTAAIVPVDAPMVTLGDMVRGTWAREFGPRNGTIFSYVMNNYWFTNYIAAQGGDFRFRYVLTSGRDLVPASLSRLGWEEMAPLEVDQITSQDKAIEVPRPLDSVAGSFLQVDQPNVVLVTWKKAEDGEGTILRFLEIGGKESTVNVETKLLNVKSAWSSDAFERKQAALGISPHGFKFNVKPFQILTVRVEGTAAMAGN